MDETLSALSVLICTVLGVKQAEQLIIALFLLCEIARSPCRHWHGICIKRKSQFLKSLILAAPRGRDCLWPSQKRCERFHDMELAS
jgi:hypothetical protein